MNEMTDEAEFVVDILKGKGKMTTTQIEDAIKAQGIACRDAASRFLPGLRASSRVSLKAKRGCGGLINDGA